MLSPRAGRVSMDGKALPGQASCRAARAGLGLVPEGRQVFPHLSVRESLVATTGNRHQRAQPWTLGTRGPEGLAPLIRAEIWSCLGRLRDTGPR